MRLTDGKRTRRIIIGGCFAAATVFTWLLIPPADYLPDGKQGWVFAFILRPPGQSVTTAREEFANPVAERMETYLDPDHELAVDNYFMGVFGAFGFAGAGMVDIKDADPFIEKFNSEVTSIVHKDECEADRVYQLDLVLFPQTVRKK